MIDTRVAMCSWLVLVTACYEGIPTTVGPTLGLGSDDDTASDVPLDDPWDWIDSDTTGAATDTLGLGSSGATSTDGSTDGAGSGGETETTAAAQPEEGWWSPCESSDDDCLDELECLRWPDLDRGACTYECVVHGDPSTCGAAPGGDAVPACAPIDGDSVCVLDCSEGRTCPAGLECLMVAGDNGPLTLCS